MPTPQADIGSLAFLGVSPAYMINPVYKTFPPVASINGRVDVYTCPAGKKAMILHSTVCNTTGGSITQYSEIYIGGTYYKVRQSTSITNNSTTGFSGFTFVLEAGMKYALNCSATGINFWTRIVEFDDDTPIKTAYLTALTNGNSTMYTCPAGKVALILGASGSAFDSGGTVYFYNSSGGSRLMGVNLVPSGGSPGTSNLAQSSTVGSDAAFNTGLINAFLGAGDFISVSSNAATATQFAWVNIAEMPV